MKDQNNIHYLFQLIKFIRILDLSKFGFTSKITGKTGFKLDLIFEPSFHIGARQMCITLKHKCVIKFRHFLLLDLAACFLLVVFTKEIQDFPYLGNIILTSISVTLCLVRITQACIVKDNNSCKVLVSIGLPFLELVFSLLFSALEVMGNEPYVNRKKISVVFLFILKLALELLPIEKTILYKYLFKDSIEKGDVEQNLNSNPPDDDSHTSETQFL